ncbi:serine/threonine-protein kinase [Nonomuraea sp. NPDC003560]|uniref:serine/threonine-protein kinase n=1 Tax=Nonomuraea sp. NPDC003560 TaxID=3364341 RepID=UPI003689C601
MSDPGGFGPLEMDEREPIGPYRIVGRMGAGGMGVVYAGVAPDGGRVAVKVIHPGLAADPHFHDRFVREVEMLSRVRGRCTVAVLSADTAASPPWLATEFVPGPTLTGHVRDHGPLPPDGLVAFGVDIAEALTDIHGAGIVHRDLKPGNVILAASGAKVLDFGIARALDESGLTGTGALIGSPGWISPEQYRGDQADAAADVFAWGALMVYAATGRPPFGTGAPDVLAYRVMSVDPDLSGVPEGVRDLVRAALAKDRAARPGAAELLGALRSGTLLLPRPSSGTLPLTPPPPPPGTLPLTPPPPGGHGPLGPPSSGGQGPLTPPSSGGRARLWPVAAAVGAVVAVVAVGAAFALNAAGTPDALPSQDDGPTSSYTDPPATSADPDPTDTPEESETPEETPTPEDTPTETDTPEKTPEATPTKSRPRTLPCASSGSILREAAALNGGSLPQDAVVARKRCVGSWVAAELSSPSVGAIDLIARRNASRFLDAQIGSNFCSLEGRPALVASAPASIKSFLCPNGFG